MQVYVAVIFAYGVSGKFRNFTLILAHAVFLTIKYTDCAKSFKQSLFFKKYPWGESMPLPLKSAPMTKNKKRRIIQRINLRLWDIWNGLCHYSVQPIGLKTLLVLTFRNSYATHCVITALIFLNCLEVKQTNQWQVQHRVRVNLLWYTSIIDSNSKNMSFVFHTGVHIGLEAFLSVIAWHEQWDSASTTTVIVSVWAVNSHCPVGLWASSVKDNILLTKNSAVCFVAHISWKEAFI